MKQYKAIICEIMYKIDTYEQEMIEDGNEKKN